MLEAFLGGGEVRLKYIAVVHGISLHAEATEREKSVDDTGNDPQHLHLHFPQVLLPPSSYGVLQCAERNFFARDKLHIVRLCSCLRFPLL